MHTHAPIGYVCPFCLVARGVEDEHVLTRQSDLVYRDETVTAFIASHQWPNHRGHVLLIPNDHFENLYDLPPRLALPLHETSRAVAQAMKAAYGCEGIS